MRDPKDLIHEYLFGDMSKPEVTEFLQRLKIDPALRSEWGEALENEALLWEMGQGKLLSGIQANPEASLPPPAQAKAVRESNQDAPRGRTSTRRRVSLFREYRSSWVAGWAAAGVLFGLVVLAALWRFNSGETSHPPSKSRLAIRNETEAQRKKVEEETIRAETKRPEAEERLREIKQRQEELARAAAPPAGAAGDEKRKLVQEREQIEREMREEIERARNSERPAPIVRGQDEKPQVSREPPVQRREAKTQAVIARVEEVSWEAFLVTKEGRSPATLGADVTSAHGLETGAGATHIVLRFPDKTRVELGPETAVNEVKVELGKRMFVAKGAIKAEVSKQPKDQPIVFATPHGEAKVLGTTLRLVIDSDPKKGTWLDVDEGKVELKNLAGKTVMVESGHYAIAAVGVELVSRPQDPPALAILERSGEVTISFGPEGRKLPQGVLIDSGEGFEAKRGYGWVGPNLKDVKFPERTELAYRRRAHLFGDEKDLRTSYISAGRSSWSMKLPKGRYLVTVSVGRFISPAGPNQVRVQGVQVIDSVMTPVGQSVEGKDVPVEVKDDTLRMVLDDPPQISGTLSDTAVNFIKIKKR